MPKEEPEQEPDPTKYLDAYEQEARELRGKNSELAGAISHSNFADQRDGNLIQFQLNPNEILDQIQHFLKGDKLEQDDDGNVMYIEQDDENLVLLNEYGLNWFMQTLQQYVNKNTMLSFYDEIRINEILGDLGDVLNNFILHNYEKIGLDTEYKKTRYESIVIYILHMIESCYRQALQGKQREILNNNNINISQNEGWRGQPQASNPIKKQFNLFNPSTWV